MSAAVLPFVEKTADYPIDDRQMLTEETNQLRQALEDTIEVLERTRHAFKSRELGQLRRRLVSLLERFEESTDTSRNRAD